ncbi:YqgE/AlgH family protein [Aquabacterium sp. A08]|uniref:YqgE/AlgH family protein n=1 Tax=Aquabacterium sp. A08 TaxID=2718532 RepID=UPI00141D8FF5|nr:YqgE/AlgH family protein [Aquabacterium sp. A08]NIC42616.1 YqgE/AlgH family protein [Aquabacterium sp. A08]
MPLDPAAINLTHHFLIAMPGLNDELFGRSVVYLCEHTPKGALGLIINKPSDITVADLFEKVDLPLRRPELAALPVFHGGPLQPERGFVLHEAMGDAQPVGTDETPPAVARAIREALSGLELDESTDPAEAEAPEAETPAPRPSAYASTLRLADGLEMTTSRDVLEALSSGAGPRKVLLTLGYASWGEGQLESEITENSWLTVEAQPALIFDTPVEQRYEKAMGLLGLQPWMLAPGSGHA